MKILPKYRRWRKEIKCPFFLLVPLKCAPKFCLNENVVEYFLLKKNILLQLKRKKKWKKCLALSSKIFKTAVCMAIQIYGNIYGNYSQSVLREFRDCVL